jgi:hypothetical protein
MYTIEVNRASSLAAVLDWGRLSARYGGLMVAISSTRIKRLASAR